MPISSLKQGPRKDLHIIMYADTVAKLDRIVQATGRSRTAVLTALVDECDEEKLSARGSDG